MKTPITGESSVIIEKSYAAEAREFAAADSEFQKALEGMPQAEQKKWEKRLSRQPRTPKEATVYVHKLLDEITAAKRPVPPPEAPTPVTLEDAPTAGELSLQYSDLMREVNALLTSIPSTERQTFEDRARAAGEVAASEGVSILETLKRDLEAALATTSRESVPAAKGRTEEQKERMRELVRTVSALKADISLLIKTLTDPVQVMFLKKFDERPRNVREAIPYLTQLKADIEAAANTTPEAPQTDISTADTDPVLPVDPEVDHPEASDRRAENQALSTEVSARIRTLTSMHQEIYTELVKEVQRELQEAESHPDEEEKNRLLNALSEKLKSAIRNEKRIQEDEPKDYIESERFALLNKYLRVRTLIEKLPNGKELTKDLAACTTLLNGADAKDKPDAIGEMILQAEQAIEHNARLQTALETVYQSQTETLEDEIFSAHEELSFFYTIPGIKNQVEEEKRVFTKATNKSTLFEKVVAMAEAIESSKLRWTRELGTIIDRVRTNIAAKTKEMNTEQLHPFTALDTNLKEIKAALPERPLPISVTSLRENLTALKNNLDFIKSEDEKVNRIDSLMRAADFEAERSEWVSIQEAAHIPDSPYVVHIQFKEGNTILIQFVKQARTLEEAKMLLERKAKELQADPEMFALAHAQISERIPVLSTKNGQFGITSSRIYHPINYQAAESERKVSLKGDYAYIKEGTDAELYEELKKQGWSLIDNTDEREIRINHRLKGGLLPGAMLSVATYFIQGGSPIDVAKVTKGKAATPPIILVNDQSISPHRANTFRTHSEYALNEKGAVRQNIIFTETNKPVNHSIEGVPLETYLFQRNWVRITPEVLERWKHDVPQRSLISNGTERPQFPTVREFYNETTGDRLLFAKEFATPNQLPQVPQEVLTALEGYTLTTYSSFADTEDGPVQLHPSDTVKTPPVSLNEQDTAPLPSREETPSTPSPEGDASPTPSPEIAKQNSLLKRILEGIKSKKRLLIKTLALSVALTGVMRQDTPNPLESLTSATHAQKDTGKKELPPEIITINGSDPQYLKATKDSAPELSPIVQPPTEMQAEIPDAGIQTDSAEVSEIRPLDDIQPDTLKETSPVIDSAPVLFEPEAAQPDIAQPAVADKEDSAITQEEQENRKELGPSSELHEITVKKGDGIRLAAIKFLTLEIAKKSALGAEAAHERAADAVLQAVIYRRLQGKKELDTYFAAPGFTYTIDATIQGNGGTEFTFIMPGEAEAITAAADTEQLVVETDTNETEQEKPSLELKEGESISPGDMVYYISPKTGKALYLEVFNIKDGIVQFARPSRPNTPFFAAKETTVIQRTYAAAGMKKNKQFLSKEISPTEAEIVLTSGGTIIRAVTEYIAEKTRLNKDLIRPDITVDLLTAGVSHTVQPGHTIHITYTVTGSGNDAHVDVNVIK